VLSRCGYYALLTNKEPQHLSIKDAMLAHKKQYKSEHIYRRAKGPLSIEPIYVHTPERIEAFLLLFKIALQMVVLIERTARENIRQRDRGLDGFMPNRKDVHNPRSEYLLKEFRRHRQGPGASAQRAHLRLYVRTQSAASRNPVLSPGAPLLA
jgi:transposase